MVSRSDGSSLNVAAVAIAVDVAVAVVVVVFLVVFVFGCNNTTHCTVTTHSSQRAIENTLEHVPTFIYSFNVLQSACQNIF